MHATRIVLDTNAFVAAGFNPRSASARIVAQIRRGELRMIWNEATREEIRHVLTQIPRLTWRAVEDLFRDEDRFDGAADPGAYDYVSDPADRKFLALAEAAGATLVTSDRHLLEHRDRVQTLVRTPVEFSRDPGPESPGRA